MFNASDAQTRNVLPDVHFALPAPELRPLLTTYYGVTTPCPLEDHLHPEWGNIRFTTRGLWSVSRPGSDDPTPTHGALFGPSDVTGIVRCAGAGAMLGVGLTALGWATLVSTPAHRHANRIEDLALQFGGAAERLWADLCRTDWEGCCALFDAFFTAAAAAAPPPGPMIMRVQQALVNGNLETVRHFGRNTLPAFTLFEKRFCRPRGADARKPGELWGFNHQTLSFATGPGYFIAREDPSRPEVLIDYTNVPAGHPEGWPEVRRNEIGLSRFVYGHMIDTLRRVSEHVTIGSAARKGRELGSWFILARQA